MRAEGEEGQEGQEQPGEPEADEVVAELLVVEELPGEPEDDAEDGRRHQRARCRRRARPARRRPARAAARGSGPPRTTGSSRYGKGGSRGGRSNLVDLLQPGAAGQLQEHRGQLLVLAAGQGQQLVHRARGR